MFNERIAEVKYEQIILYIFCKIGSYHNVGINAIYRTFVSLHNRYFEEYQAHLSPYGVISIQEFMQIIKDMQKGKLITRIKSAYFKHDYQKYLPLVTPNLDYFNGQEFEFMKSTLANIKL